jgi:hypothetical protein
MPFDDMIGTGCGDFRQDEQDGQDGEIDRVYLVYSDTLSVFAFAGAVLLL